MDLLQGVRLIGNSRYFHMDLKAFAAPRCSKYLNFYNGRCTQLQQALKESLLVIIGYTLTPGMSHIYSW